MYCMCMVRMVCGPAPRPLGISFPLDSAPFPPAAGPAAIAFLWKSVSWLVNQGAAKLVNYALGMPAHDTVYLCENLSEGLVHSRCI